MKLKFKEALVLGSILFASATATWGQDAGAPPALFKPGAEIDSELAAAAATSSAAGAAITISPGISIRNRSSAVENYAVMHPYSVEIYHIMAGSGILVTGGRLVLPLADSPSDDVVRTEHGIEGGLERRVQAGDVLVLQPGTPHWFRQIDGDSITYMESRVRISTAPIQYQ